jgi:allantoin racemase
MRILIINGNTTQAITDRAVAAAQATAGAAAQIIGLTAPFGPAVVTIASENEIAARAILQALAEHHHGFDAVILAISFDTALAEARALVPIPVHGITEEALKAAASLSDRIGVISIGEVSQPLYRDVFTRYPESRLIVGRSVIDMADASSYVTAGSLDERIVAEAERLSREAKAEAVVICGAALAGAGARLQPRLSRPLIDGVQAATRAALAAAG